MKFAFKVFISCVAFLALPSFADTWSPIPGIPAPPFGYAEEPPPLPQPWNQETAGFYYVCDSCSGSGNPTYGTPTSPRSSIPGTIRSGDVVVLAGNYGAIDQDFSCSQADPCFLIGDPANPPTISGESYLNGTGFIVDGLNMTLANNDSGSTLGITGDYGAFRNGSVSGNNDSGGMYTTGSYIVIANNMIADNGDPTVNFDQDRHGLKVNGNHNWIIGNEFARNSGDGMQIGGTSTFNSVNHIYVGNNISHDNKQTGYWVKEAQDIIFSSNLAYGHEHSDSSGGEGMGGQYDNRNVWFLFNESRDNGVGIGIKSSNNGGGSGHYIVGNYIHGNFNNDYDPGDAWSRSAVMSWNNADLTIVNNTIDNNVSGINLNGNTGPTYIYNNAITNMTHSGAKAIFAGDSGDVKVNSANTSTGQETIDAGIAPVSARDPYAIFADLYGLNIYVDYMAMRRPVGQWDVGAFESQGPAGPKPLAPVITNVN